MAIYSGEFIDLENPVLVIGEMGLVRSLGEMDLPLFLGTEIEKNIAAHSRYVKQRFFFSPYDSEEFIDELCELGYYFKKKPVILSDDDRAILNISENRNKLKAYYLFLYPERKTVNKILNKQYFSELAERHELPVPVSYQTTSSRDFREVASKINYPCIIKPTQRHFWWGDDFIEQMGHYQKAVKCSDLYQFKDTCQKISEVNPSVVIQEYVEGDDKQHYSANLFVDERGKLQGYYIARKKRIYPIKAGTGSYVETVVNPAVLEISMKIVEKLGLRGLVNIQFKQDSRTAEYKLLEIHARNSLWSLLGAKAGANLAYLYYNYLVYGLHHDNVIKARPNIKYFNLSKDVRALLAYRNEGKLTVAEWWQSLRGERIFAAFSWKDPLPALFKIWDIVLNSLKRAVKKKLPQPKRLKHESFLTRNASFLTRIF
ncbi:MAG TPA: ATP-grasp domain-containing protein [Balneolaceae bacterium]